MGTFLRNRNIIFLRYFTCYKEPLKLDLKKTGCEDVTG
jgi:hypothetical protein